MAHKDDKTVPDGTSLELASERVWDMPVRLFHWALAICVGVSWYLGYFRSFDTIDWHFYLGYGIGALVVFRLIWGVVGPGTARLSSLFWSPRTIARYAATMTRRSPSGFRGHSPLGSLSVIALLVSLIVQVITGLCAEDDALFSSGPLAGYVSSETVLSLTSVHYYNSRILIGLIGLHVLAILFYLVWKRENLVVAMVTGRKDVAVDHDQA